MSKHPINLKINGREYELIVESRELLVHVLRDRLGLTGTHIGCETTHCGVCTVDLNGRSVKSCTILAVQANGAEIMTVEGLADNGELQPLQANFREAHGLQCGFCTPGMLIRAYRLLQEEPNLSDKEIRYHMAGNLCRCTGYQNIIKAVRMTVEQQKAGAENHGS